MRILHIGDIVGKPGRQIVVKSLPGLIARESLGFVIANGENIAGGSGITRANYNELIEAGVDCVTLGDHIYRRKEIGTTLEANNNILKPANYPDEAPGRGWTVLNARDGRKVAVVSAMGRVFMRPVDCPFRAMDDALASIGASTKIIFVDFHAEATSDMQVMGRYLDGKVSSILGTHTHVTTADEQIFPEGTAFQCDIGMTGPHKSILGRRIERVMETTRNFNPTTFDVASEDVRISGTIVDVDANTGRATSIRRICVDEAEAADLAKAKAALAK